MREVDYNIIVDTVARLCTEANYFLGEDVVNAFKKGLETEESPTGKDILNQLLKNAEIAKTEKIPICQDCGYAIVFLELGEDAHVKGNILNAIKDGVKKGYTEGYLRKSILADPIKGKNTGDNTPPIIHTTIVPGDKIKITVAPKGGGSENMSEVKWVNRRMASKASKSSYSIVYCARVPIPVPRSLLVWVSAGTLNILRYWQKRLC